jgi:S-DNA-T family DNA segregation ATPase FtsK/SpoIIIE
VVSHSGERPAQRPSRPAEWPKRRLRGIAYGCLAILLLVALLGYDPAQCPWLSTMAAAPNGPHNPIGTFGLSITFGGLSTFGLSYLLIPGFLLRSSHCHIFRNSRPMGRGRFRAMILALALGPIFLAQLQSGFAFLRCQFLERFFLDGLGGWIGDIAYTYIFFAPLGSAGTALVVAVPFFLALWCVFTGKNSLSEAMEGLLEKLNRFLHSLFRLPRRLLTFPFGRKKTAGPSAFELLEEVKNSLPIAGADGSEILEELDSVDDALLAMKKGPMQGELFEKGSFGRSISAEPYVFPSLDLLDNPGEGGDGGVARDVLALELREALEQFGVEVEIGEIQSGPVITRFEVLPAPGVRVEKIVSLDKNIALTLRAPSVRILAPVPGKNCVGIEVPNVQPVPVCLRGILESEEWRNKTAEIPIVLGRGVTGEPLIADLARMPHLLIAGATGSGKTVCINSILASFLFHASPEDLRLILVDPKIVEMQVYNRLPHMLLPTLTDPKKVPNALRWRIGTMEWRYHLFASVGVRNIAGFNGKVTRTREEMERADALEKELSPEERAAMATVRSGRREVAAVPQQKLPYIVCVIDELADLMLVAPDDIENSVTRLAQLARAAGIHLILATQRPSVNVITGVIKANLPSRIAFKVASKVDSRTILDANGADSLLGRGDMLFLPPGAFSLQRAQGAWVSDEEINRVVDFLARGGPPHFDRQAMAFVESPESAAGSPPGA